MAASPSNCVLVTGGAGFIGSHLVRTLVKSDGYQVVNLDKLTYAGNLESLEDLSADDRHHFVHGDIGDAGLVKELLAQHGPCGVVHLAAESHVDRSIDAPAPFVQTNVLGTLTLLEAALDYWRGLPPQKAQEFRFLHVSTDEVYGSLEDTGRFDEAAPYAPNSPYAASKAAADHFARAYHRTFDLPVLITNCSNNYGPFQYPEKLIPLVIFRALAGQSLPIYGDGLQVRDWLYVEDHVAALLKVLTRGRPGERYLVGGDAERTNLEVVEAVCRTLDRMRPDLPHVPCASLIEHVADRPGHDRRYAIDASRLRKELDWTPATDFNDGIERTVRWYLDHEGWSRRVMAGAYSGERLGRSGDRTG